MIDQNLSSITQDYINQILQKGKKLNKYNLIVLFKPTLEDDSLKAAIDEITSYIKEEQIQIHDIEIQKKDLKYKIKNEINAQFVIIKIISYPEKIKVLEQKIKHKKNLIRYIILKTKEHIQNMFAVSPVEYNGIHPINDLGGLLDNCGRIRISKKVHPKYKRKIAKVIKTSRSIGLLPLK